VPAAVFHPSWSRARPARAAGAARGADPAPARAPEPVAAAPAELFTKEDEAKLAQRLRDLGYIE
jgi:hypothetical protein